MTIEEAAANIGRGVVYEPGDGRRESGVITSVNHRFAFVRYGSDRHAKATSPEDLTLEFVTAPGEAEK